MNFFNKNKVKIAYKSKEDLIESFFENGLHTWIKQNKFILSSIYEFFDVIPFEKLKVLCGKYPLVLARSSGRYACAAPSLEMNLIILFPEVVKMLASFNNEIGKAILAHELGHIFYNHAGRNISELEAQVEADTFAVELGYGYALSEFLESEEQSIDTRVRLTYITSKLLSES